MPKPTKAEKVIAYLKSCGCSEVTSKSRKYRTFTRPGREGFYYVGKCGALRAGKTVSDSISLSR